MKPRPVPPDREAWNAVHRAETCSAEWGVASRRSKLRILDKGYRNGARQCREAGIKKSGQTLTGELSWRTWRRAALDVDVGRAGPSFGACSAARASASNARCRASTRSFSRNRVRSSSTLVPFLFIFRGQNA